MPLLNTSIYRLYCVDVVGPCPTAATMLNKAVFGQQESRVQPVLKHVVISTRQALCNHPVYCFDCAFFCCSFVRHRSTSLLISDELVSKPIQQQVTVKHGNTT